VAVSEAFPPLEAVGEPASALPDGPTADIDAMLDGGGDHLSPDLTRAILWAYRNLENRKAKPQDAPGLGAWSLLTWARGSRNRFFEQLLPKALTAHDGDDEERKNIREEQKSIAEIQCILERFRPYTAEEARAKVENHVDDWTARFSVALSPEARTCLADRMFAFREEWNGRNKTSHTSADDQE
jgi:hypothetical protein